MVKCLNGACHGNLELKYDPIFKEWYMECLLCNRRHPPSWVGVDTTNLDPKKYSDFTCTSKSPFTVTRPMKSSLRGGGREEF